MNQKPYYIGYCFVPNSNNKRYSKPYDFEDIIDFPDNTKDEYHWLQAIREEYSEFYNLVILNTIETCIRKKLVFPIIQDMKYMILRETTTYTQIKVRWYFYTYPQEKKIR
jgi:hypothetical protein